MDNDVVKVIISKFLNFIQSFITALFNMWHTCKYIVEYEYQLNMTLHF